MRWKIVGAIVIGLLFITVAPLSQSGAGRGLVSLAAKGTPRGQRAAANDQPAAAQAQAAAAAAAAAMDCILVVPADPLTAKGLSTPFQLTQARGNPACHMANPGVQAFVQGAVLDPATGKISIYNPLVIDRGTRPAVAPTVPALPANAVVGLWMGFNGTNLTLAGPGAAQCVNGVRGSIFGQFSFCNAPAFFQQANAAIQAAKLKVPDLGTAADAKPCPTVRDFSVVDQDQSDNVTTTYLVTPNGRTAQDTPENRVKLQNSTAASNGSDNALLAKRLASALNCQPMMAPDLASPAGGMVTALPLDELQAAAKQAAPQALVPALDPMVLVNGKQSLAKLNAYRSGVDQPAAASLADASTTTYCRNLNNTGLPRIVGERPFLQFAPTPDPAMANNLFTFLAMRAQNTMQNQAGFLGCLNLLRIRTPITLRMQGNVVVDATIRPRRV